MQIRTELHDLIVTVLRRKFIPPLMEIFQDIICISTFDYHDHVVLENNKEGQEVMKLSQFIEKVHRSCADTMYSSQKFNNMYKNIVEERANALLMDEETINFYHYNLNTQPSGIGYAVSYLMKILAILSKYNPELKDLSKQVKGLKLVRKDEISDKDPAEIVKSFESWESF